MNQTFKLGIVLALYASVACACLALVYQFTEPTITAAKIAKANAAMKVVFTTASNFEQATDFTDEENRSVKAEKLFLAQSEGKTVGAVVQATGPTYDRATILIGIDLNQHITGIQFLSLTDTPGFGQKATEPAFYNQFSGLSAQKPLELNTDFDAITGATITSKGIASIINHGVRLTEIYLKKNGIQSNEQGGEHGE